MKNIFSIKLGIICLAILISTVSLGTVFAYWTDNISVNGVINTGYLQFKLTNIETWDNDGSIGGDITCYQINETGESVNFVLSVINAYPGYNGRVDFNITNTGSIPGYIEDIIINGTAGIPSWASVDFDDITFGKDKTLEPGDSYNAYIQITIDEPGLDVLENYLFDFEVILYSMQWNYAP